MTADFMGVMRQLSQLLCCDKGGARDKTQGAQPARLICYYDLSDEVVMRQLEFRRSRKMERELSSSSLTSLGMVSEDLELPLEKMHPVPPPTVDMKKVNSVPSMPDLNPSVKRSGSDPRLRHKRSHVSERTSV